MSNQVVKINYIPFGGYTGIQFVTDSGECFNIAGCTMISIDKDLGYATVDADFTVEDFMRAVHRARIERK